ncbi:MAG: FMN-binding protein [Steroidobacteraceae bacterium]
MNNRLSGWSVLPLAVVAVPAPAYAVQYATAEQVMRSAFPGADRFEPLGVSLTDAELRRIDAAATAPTAAREPRAWLASSGGKPLGRFYVDEVLGKQLYITYSVAIADNGGVLRVDILEYRETHGYEVRNPRWLRQFEGARAGDELEPGVAIKNISGATLSCRHVTDGVHRLLLIDAARREQ